MLIGIFAASSPVQALSPASSDFVSNLDTYDPYALIAEVNALRAANGLPPLNPDPILMSVSQAHADYMASIGTVTHYGADGSRPYQRSLAAGYPVAGDLSLGGFHSENIIAGRHMTPAQAVSSWTGDALHLNTMLSPEFTDIGAGVAVAGDMVYYVIDASRKSGAAVPAYTPQVSSNGTPVYNLNPLVSTIFPNTPSADGSIVHVVKSGETLWLIAITYGTKIDEILRLNNLPKGLPIYPGQHLLIKEPRITPSPTSVTATVTKIFTASTSIAETKTPTIFFTPSLTPSSTVSEVDTASPGTNVFVPVVIVVGALAVSAILAIASGRRKRK